MSLDNLTIVTKSIFERNISSNETYLTEDLFHAVCDNYIIDCGWYENDSDGNFITYLVSDSNWDNPIIKLQVLNIDDARWSIDICMQYLETHKTTS